MNPPTMLLVPVEPPISDLAVVAEIEDDDGFYECLPIVEFQIPGGCIPLRKLHPPHAVRDVIQVGDLQAIVTEVLPPVKIDGLWQWRVKAADAAEREE